MEDKNPWHSNFATEYDKVMALIQSDMDDLMGNKGAMPHCPPHIPNFTNFKCCDLLEKYYHLNETLPKPKNSNTNLSFYSKPNSFLPHITSNISGFVPTNDPVGVNSVSKSTNPKDSHAAEDDLQYLTDIFDSIAEQYEKNNEMEDLIYKLETLNMYPNVLEKSSLDLTSTAIRLLTEALDYIVEGQTELCNRLTAIPSQDDGNQTLPVKADDQANLLNAFAQIVMFVNSLKDIIIDTEKVPALSAELEKILPKLTLSGDSMSKLDIQFNGIEDARSVLETMMQLRSAFNSNRKERAGY